MNSRDKTERVDIPPYVSFLSCMCTQRMRRMTVKLLLAAVPLWTPAAMVVL